MNILFVADGRSPIALNWIRHFNQKYEVHLVSIYPCNPDLELASLRIVPLLFSNLVGLMGHNMVSSRAPRNLIQRIARRVGTPRIRTFLRQRLLPLTMDPAAERLHAIITETKPDLVHAMRIPYEGMLAAKAKPPAPLLISVWGNDFTLHARSTRTMGQKTQSTLHRAAALHTDTHRDSRLALSWGFSEDRPAIVLPTGGGIRADVFYPSQETNQRRAKMQVINPRGLRAYVRNNTFFQAIPLVLARQPNVTFVCPAMAGEPEPERWVDELNIARAVQLLPRLSQLHLAEVFRQSDVAVSPTIHDGTPNTLLEAMACGCYPIAGDLESLREWIESGINGTLIDPEDPQALADAILLALEEPAMRVQAREHNLQLISQRADSRQVMAAAERFYQKIVGV